MGRWKFISLNWFRSLKNIMWFKNSRLNTLFSPKYFFKIHSLVLKKIIQSRLITTLIKHITMANFSLVGRLRITMLWLYYGHRLNIIEAYKSKDDNIHMWHSIESKEKY